MLLSELEDGQVGIIVRIHGRIDFRKRVTEMGFLPGKEVAVVRKAPFRDPVEYSLLGYNILLRNNEARLIEVILKTSNISDGSNYKIQMFAGDDNNKSEHPQYKNIRVVLAGNPVSGKTSLFNFLTGSREKVGNYCGVTVNKTEKSIKYNGYNIHFIDLPGIYSLDLSDNNNDFGYTQIIQCLPDIVLNVIDSTNLERSLFLTTSLIDMNINVIMALNMYDEFKKTRDKFNHESFGAMTGIPVVPVSSVKNSGKPELLEAIISVFTGKNPHLRHIHIYYGEESEKSIKVIQEQIRVPGNINVTDRYSSRFLALSLLQKDKTTNEIIKTCSNYKEIAEKAEIESKRLEKIYNSPAESIIADAKFGFITGALKETYISASAGKHPKSGKTDSILTHRWLGLPIFFFLLWVMFITTFKIGSYPMTWIENGVDIISHFISSSMAPGMLRDLIVDGIISGVGGVIVFLPNILILYFFIALMEDTGYMSRAVFMMDRIMHKIGLHGKSFIPLVMGFGCNVPAIMSTRILENRNDRLITILINPFISCNARLPVYILFISAFFNEYSGTILFALYATGILIAIVTAILLRKIFFKKTENPFVMELPPYRIPSLQVVSGHMWLRSVQYLKKIGSVILIASVIFWALSYFPLNINYSKDYGKSIEQVKVVYNQQIANTKKSDTATISKLKQELRYNISILESEKKGERKEKSYLGIMGHFIEPVIKPLGLDWRIGISIISGIPAKEIIVSTLAILYHADETTGQQNSSLIDRIKSNSSGQISPFTPLKALVFMIFVLLYIPCIGTVTAISKESGSWKWGAFTIVYTLVIAWCVAFLVNFTGTLAGY